MTHSEEPRAAKSGLRFRMKPNIHLAILWREILPIDLVVGGLLEVGLEGPK